MSVCSPASPPRMITPPGMPSMSAGKSLLRPSRPSMKRRWRTCHRRRRRRKPPRHLVSGVNPHLHILFNQQGEIMNWNELTPEQKQGLIDVDAGYGTQTPSVWKELQKMGLVTRYEGK